MGRSANEFGERISKFMEKKKLDMRVVIYLLLATALILVIRYLMCCLAAQGISGGLQCRLLWAELLHMCSISS